MVEQVTLGATETLPNTIVLDNAAAPAKAAELQAQSLLRQSSTAGKLPASLRNHFLAKLQEWQAGDEKRTPDAFTENFNATATGRTVFLRDTFVGSPNFGTYQQRQEATTQIGGVSITFSIPTENKYAANTKLLVSAYGGTTEKGKVWIAVQI